MPFDVVNQLLTKKEISDLIDAVYRHCGQKETVIFADRIMALGFHHAFKAGISFGKDDMVVPADEAEDRRRDPHAACKEFEQQYNDGLITQGEKYNKVVDAWSKCTDQIAEEMMKEISVRQEGRQDRPRRADQLDLHDGHSGARGSPAQMTPARRHARPDGQAVGRDHRDADHLELQGRPDRCCEYFNSTHGARKGLADTALKTANSGYLTRRLVDVAQDCIITEDDCGTKRRHHGARR